MYKPIVNNIADHLIAYPGQFYLINGESYTGYYMRIRKIPYVMFTDGQLGEQLYIDGDENILIYDAITNQKLNFVDPILYYPVLKQSDYDNGYFVRYFIKRKFSQDVLITEIDQKQFDKIGSTNGIDPNIYSKVQLDWKISGSRFDVIDNGLIINYGIQDTNLRMLQIKEIEMSGISNYLSNTLQFAKLTK